MEFHGSPASVKEQAAVVQDIASEHGGADFEWADTPEERTRLWTARHNAYFAAVQSRAGCRCITTDTCVPISRLADALLEKVRGHFDATAMHLALESIWSVLGAANRYFSAQEPWVLRKSDPARFATVLYTTLEVVRIAALLSQPVMPDAMAKLLDLLGQPANDRAFTAIRTRLAAGTALPAPTGVFPRYQPE